VKLDALSARPTAGGVRLELRVIPRSPRNQVAGIRDGRLLVRVTAPPVDSAANEAVIACLAGAIDRAKRDIRIVAGDTSRNKTVEIDRMTVAELLNRLHARIPESS
jgi:uncharacterized protein (TIGR00251 family)